MVSFSSTLEMASSTTTSQIPQREKPGPLIVVRWCVVDTRKLVGNPQEQGYDEHSSNFSLSYETKVY
jgi:hypothetical protein